MPDERLAAQFESGGKAVPSVLIVYGSTLGNTREAARRLQTLLEFPVELRDVRDLGGTELLEQADILIFMASTWGDGELQADMEEFLVGAPLSLPGKPYAICELGNYYGYDDFEFGAQLIIRHHLESAGAIEWVEPFSMDSIPRKDWKGLERWAGMLNARWKEICHA